jgi:hypothetical protein
MQYTEKDVTNLIKSLELEFTAKFAKAEEASLAKSEEEKPEDKKEEKKPEHEEKVDHEAKHDKEAAPKHEEHSAEEHKEDAEAHGDEGHDYDDEDMEHMHKMYSSMSKGEIKAHHDCIMKCMGKAEAKPAEMEKAEGEGHKNGGEISATGEPKNGPGDKSEASDAHGDKMDKSEKLEESLLKSELEAEKAKYEDLKKNFEAVQEFLSALAKKSVPQAKAITNLDAIAKTEAFNEVKPLTKGEIHEKLKIKTLDSSLKKSDRDAITSYYLSGQINVNSISHLLK